MFACSLIRGEWKCLCVSLWHHAVSSGLGCVLGFGCSSFQSGSIHNLGLFLLFFSFEELVLPVPPRPSCPGSGTPGLQLSLSPKGDFLAPVSLCLAESKRLPPGLKGHVLSCDYNRRSLYVCHYIFSTNVTLCRFIGEDPRKYCVESEVVWMSGSQRMLEKTHVTPFWTGTFRTFWLQLSSLSLSRVHLDVWWIDTPIVGTAQWVCW